MRFDLNDVFIIGLFILLIMRWIIVRRRLHQMTEIMDALLKKQGVTNINFFRTSSLRRRLTIVQLADRLKERITRLSDALR